MAIEEQIVREAPEVEKRRIGLLDSAKALADARLAEQLPRFAVAGQDPLTTAAIQRAQNAAGIGGFQSLIPGLQTALQRAPELATQQLNPALAQLAATGRGVEALGTEAGRQISGLSPSVQQQVLAGQDVLRGGIGQFDPSGTGQFMNPFETAAVQQALADIRRAGDIQATQIGGQAAQAGAFGGSRQALLESELDRNILEQQARTAAQMRQAGFESAAQRAQQAFEAARGRQLQAGAALGQLGLQGLQQRAGLLGQGAQMGIGALGQQASLAAQGQQLGAQASEALGQAGLRLGSGAEALQQTGLRDIEALRQLGTERRALAQAGVEADRQSTLQSLYEPYQRVGFLSDIYKGAPSGQMSIASRASPQTSPGERILGLGIAGLAAAGGAAKTGLFG